MNAVEKTTINYLNKGNTFIEIDVMVKNYLNFVYTYKSYDTYICYQGHLVQIVYFLKNRYNIVYDVDVKSDYLFNFIQDQRNKNLSSATINKRLNVFKRIFKYSKSLVDLDDIPHLKEKYTTYNCLEDNEVNKLIDYINNSNLVLQNKLMLCLFLESGVRRKELRFIEIKNIDLSNDSIYLTTTKTNNKPRFVFYSDYTKYYLLEFLKTIPDRKYLFKITNSCISSCFRRIKSKLNLTNFSCYVLRHSFATIIINNDGNMEMLRQTMGHERLTTTQRYLHYNKKLLSISYKKAFNIKKD